MASSSIFCKTTSGYLHWCPACLDTHPIPDSWELSGDLMAPTVTPSLLQTGIARILDENCNWAGSWKKLGDGSLLRYRCHYSIAEGFIKFYEDCSHSFAGKSMMLPFLPWPFRVAERKM